MLRWPCADLECAGGWVWQSLPGSISQFLDLPQPTIGLIKRGACCGSLPADIANGRS